MGKTLEQIKKDLLKLNKAKLAEMLQELEVTFDTAIDKDEMVDLIIDNDEDIQPEEEKRKKLVDLDAGKKGPTKKQLETKLQQVVAEATKLNAEFDNCNTPEEQQGFVDALDDIYNGMGAVIASAYGGSYDEPIDPESPNSEIIANIPVAPMEQILASLAITYPLMNTVNIETVRNGIKSIFYNDYRDADDTSAWSDVALKDFNPGIEPIFKETFKTTVNIHKAFAMLSNELNDITFSMGLFVSLVKNYAMAIARPLAKAVFSRYITFLDTDTSFDEIINFTEDETVKKAKQMKKHFISMQTPSRTNLKKMPKGSATSLEYAMSLANVHLVVNEQFAADYTYDVLANTFNIGQVTFKVKSITELDFTKLGAYSATKGVNLIKKEVLMIEDKVYFELKHFDAVKEMNTPKLKTVTHAYMRVGNGRRKDKYLGAFEPKVI